MGLSVQQIKGCVLRSRLQFLEENVGRQAAEQLVNSLPADDQQKLKNVLNSQWYPFDLGTRLDEAIVRAVGRGDPEFFERLGEASAFRNLTTIHAAFVTEHDPHSFLRKADEVYSAYYEKGHRDYRPVSATSGVLTTTEAPATTPGDCRTVVGWHRKALEICGARDVEVVEEECRAKGGKVCRYRVEWQ